MISCNFCGKTYVRDGACFASHKASCPDNPNALIQSKNRKQKSDLNTAFTADDDSNLDHEFIVETKYCNDMNDIVFEYNDKFVIALLNIKILSTR